MNSRDKLLLLARCLAVSHDDGTLRARLADPRLPWSDVLAFANRELLTPTVWARLKEKGLADVLPAEVAEVMRRSHAVNDARNTRLRVELTGVVRVLNDVGIEPVVLKGGLDLVDPRYDHAGARILRDLDLFVPRDEMETAVRALSEAGWSQAPQAPGKFVTYYVELSRDGNLVGLDLQFYLSGQRDLLSPAEAAAGSTVHSREGVTFRALSPEHQAIHNLIHSEVQDRGTDLGFVWLRQLFDLVTLWRHHGSRLDWTAVDAHFARRRFPRLVEKRLLLAHRLLGVPMPDGIRASPWARLHYHRSLFQLRWSWLEEMMATRATLTSAVDPRLVDLVYDAGARGWRNRLGRLLHGIRLLGRHRGRVRAMLARGVQKFE